MDIVVIDTEYWNSLPPCRNVCPNYSSFCRFEGAGGEMRVTKCLPSLNLSPPMSCSVCPVDTFTYETCFLPDEIPVPCGAPLVLMDEPEIKLAMLQMDPVEIVKQTQSIPFFF